MLIKFNNIEYFSLGTYEDNNDGVYYYFQDNLNPNELYLSLLNQEMAIKLMLIGQLAITFREDGAHGFTNNKLYYVIANNLELVMNYYDSYFDEYVLNDKFLDLVFGEYSTHGEVGQPINLGERLENEPFLYSDGSVLTFESTEIYEYLPANIFIKKEFYDDFNETTNSLLSIFNYYNI